MYTCIFKTWYSFQTLLKFARPWKWKINRKTFKIGLREGKTLCKQYSSFSFVRCTFTVCRKLKNTSEEQRNKNYDMSTLEEKERNELSQISTTEDMNGTVLEENQDEKSEKIEKKKRRRGGKVKPISDIPNPVQRPLSKLPPLQMQRKP